MMGRWLRSVKHGAAACVGWDAQWIFLGASAVVFDGFTNPEVLEALACSEALALAEDMNASKLLLESNCLNVVKEINGEGHGEKRCMIIKEILKRKHDFF
jgi:hypothetical protein